MPYLSVTGANLGFMSTKHAGRPRKPATTSRGQAILDALDAQGLTLLAAAAKAGIAADSLHRVVHEPDPGWLQVKTVAAVCESLGLPLELVAPCLGKLAGKPLEESGESATAV